MPKVSGQFLTSCQGAIACQAPGGQEFLHIFKLKKITAHVNDIVIQVTAVLRGSMVVPQMSFKAMFGRVDLATNWAYQ